MVESFTVVALLAVELLFNIVWQLFLVLFCCRSGCCCRDECRLSYSYYHPMHQHHHCSSGSDGSTRVLSGLGDPAETTW